MFLLLTLAGVIGFNAVHSNMDAQKAVSSLSLTTNNFRNQFSEEKDQDKKVELVQCEIIEGAIYPVKKLDSDEYFLPSPFLSITYTIFQGSKLSTDKFYSFIPILDSLYIIYCVYRL